MLPALARLLPLPLYAPFRLGAVRLRRGSAGRSLCVLVLREARAGYRGRLAGRLAEIRPLDAPDLSFLPVDSMVMDTVYWFGVQGYEGQVARVWEALCREAGAVLEIGGNVGLFTVLGAAATAGTYTVVEPVPEVMAVLTENLRRNGLAEKVELREAAVIPASVAATVRLNIPDEHRAAPVGAHLVEGVEVGGRGSLRVLSVAGLPMRDLVAGKTAIKLDAEGIEAELLAAARDLLLAARPSLLIEVLPEARNLGAFLADLAAAAGYVISIVPEYGSERIVTVRPDQFTADLPRRFNSKDVVLSTTPLPFAQEAFVPAKT